MADQFKNIDINSILQKISEQYIAIRKLKKTELNIEKIELFTIFYKLYNISIQYAILLIRTHEAAAGLKSNTETKKNIKDILRNYYKYQDLKEEIDIIKKDLEEKIKKNNSKNNSINKKISDFQEAVEKSKQKDSEFKNYCKEYQYNNTVELNGNLVSSYSNKLQLAYDRIIKENSKNSQINNEYYEMFYENYIKLMEELNKVKNFKIIKDIDKIKKGLYVKKLKVDELLTNKNFNKKIQANSIEIPNRIKKKINNLNKYNLQELDMNRLEELKLSGRIRELTNKEKLELRLLLKKQNNELSSKLAEYKPNNRDPNGAISA